MKWVEHDSAADDLDAQVGGGNGTIGAPASAGLPRLVPQLRGGTAQLVSRPDFLYVVTPGEIENLRRAIERRQLPADFEAKLLKLADGDLTHRFVERTCRLFVALLLAVQDEHFAAATKPDCERLLRILAYVRKDDDVVADYKPNGFLDDQQEVRAAMTELATLIKTFKTWRLRHQVSALWLKAA